MGLGEVLKGISWFVDDNGRPKYHAPLGPRNSHLKWFQDSLAKFTCNCGRWNTLKEDAKEAALASLRDSVQAWPEPVLRATIEAGREAMKRLKEEGRE